MEGFWGLGFRVDFRFGKLLVVGRKGIVQEPLQIGSFQ